MTEKTKVQQPAGHGKPMISWAALLDEAITKPGYIHEAYSRFHNYSLGNRLLALFQCIQRGIQPGPLATFLKWKELGRYVKKGEKALVLCMPITCRREQTALLQDGTEKEEVIPFTHFVYKFHWFVLFQTEGAEYVPAAVPEWNEETALTRVNVQRVAFENLDGNIQGYAKPGRKIAVSPMAALPHKTLFHELAHLVLNHTEEAAFMESENTSRYVREVEAEARLIKFCVRTEWLRNNTAQTKWRPALSGEKNKSEIK